MTTAATLVAAALRESNLIPIGASPTAAEAAEGLTVLNNVISVLFGNELGEPLYDWPVIPPQRTAPVAANFPQGPGAADLTASQWPYPPVNSRLIVTTTSPVTVYFPESPSDGARMAWVPVGSPATVTFNGNGRLINGQTSTDTTVVTVATTWMYRADTGNWTPLATLAGSDPSPLPAKFDDYLICATNIRLCPRFNRQPEPATVAVLKDQRSKLVAHYRQDVQWIGGGGEIPSTYQSNGKTAEPYNFNPGV